MHTGVIPIGGTIITKDIAYRVQTSIEQAEKLKHIYGKAKVDLASDKEDIVVKGVGGRNEYKISAKVLSEFASYLQLTDPVTATSPALVYSWGSAFEP